MTKTSVVFLIFACVLPVAALGVATDAFGRPDLPEIVSRANEAESKWASKHDHSYFETCLSLAKYLLKTNISDSAKYDVFARIVERSLEKEPFDSDGLYDSPLLYGQLKIFELVLDSAPAMIGKETPFASTRKYYGGLLLKFSQTQINRRIVDYVNKPVEINVMPPPSSEPGELLVAGSDPNSISDPAIRAEYQKRIRRNRENAASNALQRDLAKTLPRIQEKTVNWIATQYSRPPIAIEELNKLLGSYGLEPSRIDRIIQQVRARAGSP